MKANRPESISIRTDQLVAIGQRPPLSVYIAQLWQKKDFVLRQAWLRSLSGGNGTLLGKLWLVLSPFLNICMYFIIFGLLLKTDRGIENFIAYLAIGIVMFGPLRGSLATGSNLINSNRPLIRGFSFPRASLAISESIKNLIDFVPDLIALAIFILIIPPHVYPGWTWLLLPFIVIARSLFTTGMILITARINLSIPDLKLLWPIVGRFWFFSSGIIFSIDHFISNPTLQQLLKANPGYVVVDMSRAVILHHQIPPAVEWLQLFGWAIFVLAFGLVVFWRKEAEYNRVR